MPSESHADQRECTEQPSRRLHVGERPAAPTLDHAQEEDWRCRSATAHGAFMALDEGQAGPAPHAILAAPAGRTPPRTRRALALGLDPPGRSSSLVGPAGDRTGRKVHAHSEAGAMARNSWHGGRQRLRQHPRWAVGPDAIHTAQRRPSAPTFSRDVAPILYKNCVGCHRPGEIAPMSLLTYAEARPWARAMTRRVTEGNMPPWHADPVLGKLRDERRLTGTEKSIIARGRTPARRKAIRRTCPPRPRSPDGWRMGKPDAVFQMAEDYAVPARARRIRVVQHPDQLHRAEMVQAIEVRPGNRALVHHVLVYYQAPPDPTLAAAAQALQPIRRSMKPHSRL